MIQNYLLKSNIKTLNILIQRTSTYLNGSLFLKNTAYEYKTNKNKNFIRNGQMIISFHKNTNNSHYLTTKAKNDDKEDNDDDIKNLSDKEIQIILENKFEILKNKNILIYEEYNNISLSINLMGSILAVVFVIVVIDFLSLPELQLEKKNKKNENENETLFKKVLKSIKSNYFKIAASLTVLILGNELVTLLT